MKPTETEIEPLLIEALRVKAELVPDVAEPFDPSVTMTGIDDRPRRSRRLIAAATVVAIVVVVGGLVVALRRDDHSVVASRDSRAPVARLSIVSLPELRFDKQEYTTAPGLNEIDFSSAGGSHQLAFDDPALANVRISAADSPGHALVQLEAGRDYTISCTIPGHRIAGERAVIHVTANEGGDPVDTVP